MLSEDRIRSMAQGRCHYVDDGRGRETFEFDDLQLIEFARAIEEAVREDERSGSMVGQISKERIPLCIRKVDGTATEEDLVRLEYLNSILREIENTLEFGKDTFLGEDPRIKQARKEERERCAGVMSHGALGSSAAAYLLHDASASIEDFKQAILAKLNEGGDDAE